MRTNGSESSPRLRFRFTRGRGKEVQDISLQWDPVKVIKGTAVDHGMQYLQADLFTRMRGFADSHKQFGTLDPHLRDIALITASKILSFTDTEMVSHATQFDTNPSSFTAYDSSNWGTVTENYQRFQKELSEAGKTTDEIKPVAMIFLRESLAYRLLREKMAEQLGCQPGQEKKYQAKKISELLVI